MMTFKFNIIKLINYDQIQVIIQKYSSSKKYSMTVQLSGKKMKQSSYIFLKINWHEKYPL
jgi:hypothetical protein